MFSHMSVQSLSAPCYLSAHFALPLLPHLHDHVLHKRVHLQTCLFPRLHLGFQFLSLFGARVLELNVVHHVGRGASDAGGLLSTQVAMGKVGILR